MCPAFPNDIVTAMCAGPAALAVRAPLRQRDGCSMSVRLRWGAGRMVHPPGRLPFSTSSSYVAVVSARHARPTLLYHAPPSRNSVSEGDLTA
eukprot:2542670-Prymnesium_polylepis.1